MNFRFKPEDFAEDKLFGGYSDRSMSNDVQKAREKQYAEIANRLLDEYVIRLPEVYNHRGSGQGWSTRTERNDTHRARLWDMQELRPTVCEHEPSPVAEMTNQEYVCRHCGKRLKATWTEE